MFFNKYATKEELQTLQRQINALYAKLKTAPATPEPVKQRANKKKGDTIKDVALLVLSDGNTRNPAKLAAEINASGLCRRKAKPAPTNTLLCKLAEHGQVTREGHGLYKYAGNRAR